jgi:hypothetical protein
MLLDTATVSAIPRLHIGHSQDGNSTAKGEKIQKIKKDMKLLLAADTMTIRKLVAITGLLPAVAVFPWKYQTIALIRQVHQALQHPQNTSHNWDWKASISKDHGFIRNHIGPNGCESFVCSNGSYVPENLFYS